MAIDTTVRPISDVRCGIRAETTFGVASDSTGADGTAYRQIPMVQVTKPTFNISRESRLLSGRGLVRHEDDSVVNARGGTVTMPFDFIATPTLLAQHLTLVTQEHSQAGSYVHTTQVGGEGTQLPQIGGTITSSMPHSVNLAYYPQSSGGTRITGAVVSDLSIAGDYGTNGGFLNCSGNYFSGFSNPLSTATSLETDFTVGNWTSVENGTFFNMGNMSTKTLTSDGSAKDLILKSFNINIANGVNRVGWNSNGDAEVYAFPEYIVTGDITVKMDANFDYSSGANVIQDFLDGDTLTLTLKIGDGTISTVGEVNFIVNCQYTGDPAQDISENGIFHTLSFEGVNTGTSSDEEAFKSVLFSSQQISQW